MGISKIVLNGVTQMDVTSDTVTASNLLEGETATAADGEKITGTLLPGRTGQALKVYRGSVARPSSIPVADNDFSVNVGHQVKYVFVKTSTTVALADEPTRFAKTWDTANTDVSTKGLPSFVSMGLLSRRNSSYIDDGTEPELLSVSSDGLSFTIYGSKIARRGMTFTWTALCLED